MIFYRIKDGEQFEKSRSREVQKMSWVAVPNKLDGDGFSTLMDHPNGAAHYGAWMVILLVASKCEPRWVLTRDGKRPHDSVSLSRISGIPKEVFDEALPRLTENEVGWIEMLNDSWQVVTDGRQQVVPTCRPDGNKSCLSTLHNKTEQNITEQNIISPEVDSTSEQVVMEFPCSGKVKSWGLTQERIQTLQELFPGIDATTEARKALAWCRDNPKRRKTANGMPTFLQNWMERNQNRGGGTRAGPVPKSAGGKPSWLITEGEDEA